ncbi:MAG: DegT/DnrJ/EryC1/StrS family aminotransferase [Bacteroidia bacterium]|nr:DegT/DnrJ/EryC1/StrS family aminotransferase [Bacteroidia bacterium]
MKPIPYLDLKGMHLPVQEAIESAFREVLHSGWFILGKQVTQFERAWSEVNQVAATVGVANGLDALRLTLDAWKIQGKLKPGDQVLVPSNTYIATWLAVTQAGLEIIPVEPDPITCLLTAEGCRKYLSPAVKAMIPVHLYGQMAPMQDLISFARENQILVLADAAQSHGAILDGIPCGAWGDATAFSFYPGKNLGALGDAGAVCSPDIELIHLIRTLGNYGSEEKYHNLYPGFNSRLDELQAALLLVKLPWLESWTRERQRLANRYLDGIRNPLIKLPNRPVSPEMHVWHIFQIQTPERDALIRFMKENEIGTVIHYPVPPHLQPAYSSLFPKKSYPVSEQIHRETLSIPLYPGLSDAAQDRVMEVMNRFVS